LLAEHDAGGDLLAANDAVNQALLINIESVAAWLLKSQILSALEDDPAALAAARMAVRAAPRDAQANYVLATVLADMRQLDSALEVLDHSFECVDDTIERWLLEDLYYERAALLDMRGDADQALAALHEGLERFPTSELLLAELEPLRKQRTRGSLIVIEGGKDYEED
jgi:tetratricopeptide (TPR) repeat protein